MSSTWTQSQTLWSWSKNFGFVYITALISITLLASKLLLGYCLLLHVLRVTIKTLLKKNSCNRKYNGDLRFRDRLQVGKTVAKLNVFKLERIRSLLLECTHDLLTHPLHLTMSQTSSSPHTQHLRTTHELIPPDNQPDIIITPHTASQDHPRTNSTWQSTSHIITPHTASQDHPQTNSTWQSTSHHHPTASQDPEPLQSK